MNRKVSKICLILVVVCVLLFIFSGCKSAENQQGNGNSESATREIVDMRGETVTIPTDPQRVAIIDKGFLIQNMVAMGIADKIVATGGLVQPTTTVENSDSAFLHPEILTLPQIGYPTDAIDFETLAGADPDLVILQNSEYIKDSEITASAIKKIEELGIPLVVVNGPGCYDQVKLETQYDGIKLLGDVFNTQKRADEITALIKKNIALIQEKTAGVNAESRPSVMYIGLLTGETVGSVWGENFGDAKFSSEVANIKNVYTEHGRSKMSAEQIIALNPEVIVLCTNTVKPDPNILKNDPVYESLRNISAIQNDRISSLGYLTWWGDFRLEFPGILMVAAKSAYPDKFQDINVSQWFNDYHKKLYNLSDEEAQKLKTAQQMNWMDEANF